MIFSKDHLDSLHWKILFTSSRTATLLLLYRTSGNRYLFCTRYKVLCLQSRLQSTARWAPQAAAPWSLCFVTSWARRTRQMSQVSRRPESHKIAANSQPVFIGLPGWASRVTDAEPSAERRYQSAGVRPYVMTCCTTVRSWEQPRLPQCIFLSRRRNLLGKFLLMYL